MGAGTGGRRVWQPIMCWKAIFGRADASALDKITIPPSVEIKDVALNEQTAKGIQFTCVPSKKGFAVGEPVNLWSQVTNNATDSTKTGMVAWNPMAGSSHFCLARDKASWMTGILPQVVPKVSAIPSKSGHLRGRLEYIFFLLPHAAKLLNSCSPIRLNGAEMYRGIVVYDPVNSVLAASFGSDALEKARQACVFSNPFEFEVIGTK